MRIRVAVGVVAGRGVGVPVPGIAAALGNRGGGMLRVVDGEMQGDDAVAAGGSPVGDGVCGSVGAGGVGMSVPGVAAAGGDGLHALRGDAVFNVDGDADRLTGTPVVEPCDGVSGCRCWIGYETRGTQTIAPDVGSGTRGHNEGALVEVYDGVAGDGYHGDGRDGEV